MTRPSPESSAGARLAWATAFVLGAVACVAALASGWLGASRGRLAAAAIAAAAALALLVCLGLLRQGYRRAVEAVARGAADTQRQAAEAARFAVESQHLAGQLQRLNAEVQDLCRREEQQQAGLSARSAALDEAAGYLAGVQIPAVMAGTAVPPVPAEVAPAGGQATGLCDQVLAAVSRGVSDLRGELEERGESSRLAVVALARRVQASAHRIQEEATRMAGRHPADPDVLESSMRVDHAAAQQARHAQSVAVLCGEWPGQQWPEPLALVDVVRAAASRIVPFQRVAALGDPDMAVAAPLAEPLIHLVAELLANSTQSSPPATQVQVTVRAVQRGAVIEIDDGGIGMDDHRLEQAREIAAGRRPLGLGELGEIPQTGLAVVGQYVRRHGFRVDLLPSPYGGIRAVVLVPDVMVETLEPAGSLPGRRAEAPGGTAAVHDPPAVAAGESPPVADPPEEPAAPAAQGGTGLPQRYARRRRLPERAPVAPAPPGAPSPLPSPTPEEAGAWMGAYLAGSAPGAGDGRARGPGREEHRAVGTGAGGTGATGGPAGTDSGQ